MVLEVDEAWTAVKTPCEKCTMDEEGTRSSRGLRAGAGLALGLIACLAVSCPAQDVVYSQADGFAYSRYEQYGFGRNAVVRYQGTETVPYSPGVYVQSEANLQRVGTAPAFGSFAGNLVTIEGPTPSGLYHGLGPGAQVHGQVRNTLISQPYYQWTPNGFVLVLPRPYFARANADGQRAGPRAAQPAPVAPGQRAAVPAPAAPWAGPAPVPAGANGPGPVAPQAPAEARPAPIAVVPPPPAAIPPP
jgi:hypothetical protein